VASPTLAGSAARSRAPAKQLLTLTASLALTVLLLHLLHGARLQHQLAEEQQKQQQQEQLSLGMAQQQNGAAAAIVADSATGGLAGDDSSDDGPASMPVYRQELRLPEPSAAAPRLRLRRLTLLLRAPRPLHSSEKGTGAAELVLEEWELRLRIN
jgi:hypothetical protein